MWLLPVSNYICLWLTFDDSLSLSPAKSAGFVMSPSISPLIKNLNKWSINNKSKSLYHEIPREKTQLGKGVFQEYTRLHIVDQYIPLASSPILKRKLFYMLDRYREKCFAHCIRFSPERPEFDHRDQQRLYMIRHGSHPLRHGVLSGNSGFLPQHDFLALTSVPTWDINISRRNRHYKELLYFVRLYFP